MARKISEEDFVTRNDFENGATPQKKPNKFSMSRDKLLRVVTASAVAGTVLFVTLLGVLIYQFVTIGVYNDRINKVTQEIEALGDENDELGEDLDFYNSAYGKFLLALEKGFIIEQGK